MWYEILLTILSGVIVFVLSQFCLELWIKPRVEYKKTISKIIYSLSYYANVISNPMIIHRDKQLEEFKDFINSKHAQASEELRKLGCEVITFRFKKKQNEHISGELIYLSNTMWYYEDSAPIKGDRPSIRLRELQNYIVSKNKAKKR